MSKNTEKIPLTLQDQIKLEITNKIKSGKYLPGDKIPSEPQLVKIYNVSRVTVRNAIQQLVDENILIKRHGKGTFVKSRIYTENYFCGGSFTETCIKMNATPYTRIISIERNKIDLEVSELLNNEQEAIIIKRVRYVDSIPCIIEIDYFPIHFDFLLETPIEKTSLIQLLTEKSGVVLSKFEDKFQISFSNKEFSDLLHTTVGTPLLLVTQTVSSPDDDIIYVNKQFILTSKYIYAVRSYK